MSVDVVCRSRTCVNQIGGLVSTHILHSVPRMCAQDPDCFRLKHESTGSRDERELCR